ncbi:MAG: hypothetical protein AAF368_19105 [Planctomycetota bacterium]
MFNWLKRRRDPAPINEALIPVPIPPLVDLLALKEEESGRPLREGEVLAIRDKAVCMMLPLSKAESLADARGYTDIDPEHAWDEWQRRRTAPIVETDE